MTPKPRRKNARRFRRVAAGNLLLDTIKITTEAARVRASVSLTPEMLHISSSAAH